MGSFCFGGSGSASVDVASSEEPAGKPVAANMAQCHLVLATAGFGRKLEGGPPGPRGTPSSRSRISDISLMQTPAGRLGRRPRTRGSRSEEHTSEIQSIRQLVG